MSSFTTSDGVRLDYVESGDPVGRPVVLVAGFKAAASSWLYQVPALVKAGFRVIAFDRRGHGTSEAPDHGASMQRHGADLRELLEHLALEGAALVGGSMGGNTIWSAIEQSGTARVAGIVIVDQTPRMLNGDGWDHGFYDYDDATRDTAFATGIPDPRRHPLTSKGLVRIVRLLRALAAARGRGSREFTAPELELLNDHAKADWRPVIATTDVPVLFVAGAESEFWPSTHAAAAAELAPRGSSLVIERDGHPANIEQPRAFNEALLAFLGRL
jgi:non-heme chloroperoxidase